MSKRIAALDLGTNTFHLLIADVAENQIKSIVHAEQSHVKLGEGGISKGLLSDEAQDRALAALTLFSASIRKFNVDEIRTAGTAALRSAQNTLGFMDKIREKTGLNIDVIDGDREAILIFKGVQQAVNTKGNYLVMDIGGGSVEFIIAAAEAILWKKSYPIGAARLMAVFHHSDPISEAERLAIHQHLDGLLTDLILEARKRGIEQLIGSAGAFETFASLSQFKQGHVLKAEKTYSFDTAILNGVLEDIINSVHDERAANPLILPVRTDMIVVASILTRYVLQQLKISSVTMTSYALKEGLLVD